MTLFISGSLDPPFCLAASVTKWVSPYTTDAPGASQGLSGPIEATRQGAAGHESPRAALPHSAGLQQTFRNQETKAEQWTKVLPAYLRIREVKWCRGMTRNGGGCFI